MPGVQGAFAENTCHGMSGCVPARNSQQAATGGGTRRRKKNSLSILLTIECGQPEACVRLMTATQIAAWPKAATTRRTTAAITSAAPLTCLE